MGYIEDSLNPGETIKFEAKLSKAMFIIPILVVLFFFIFACIIFSAASSQSDTTALNCVATIFVLVGILGLGGLIDAIVNYNTTRFAVTDKRIIAKRGFIRRRSLELLLTKVESINVQQSLMGRIFNFGVIVVVGTGGTKEGFPNIADPMEFRKRLNAQISGNI
jgi:uncharacterized membrane protein YdbT with pleckstrin-like domain